MRAYITNLHAYNCGCLIGKWIDFPISDENLQSTLREIGVVENYEGNGLDDINPDLIANDLVGEEYFFTDYETDDIPFNTRHIVGEYTSISVLNELAEIINGLSSYDLQILESYCESEYNPEDIDDLQKIIDNIQDGKFILLSDVYDNNDLGHYIIEEGLLGKIPSNLENYLDFDSIGDDWSYNGAFTSNGFLMEA